MVIRVGTWNLEILFKPPNPFASKTEEEYQAKLDASVACAGPRWCRLSEHVYVETSGF